MKIDSIYLSSDRHKPNPMPIDPLFLKKVESHVSTSFNNLLKKDEFVLRILNGLFGEGFECVIFGGWVRDRVIEFITGRTIKSKDIDFVCKGQKKLSKLFIGNDSVNENMFGGYFIENATMHIDVWELDKTYLISKNSLSNEFSSLLGTADYTINSIIYYPQQFQTKSYLLDFGCIESIKNQQIDFLADEVAFPLVQAARAAIFSAKFNLSLSKTISCFIRNTCNNELNINKVLSGIDEFCPQEYKDNAKNIIKSIV